MIVVSSSAATRLAAAERFIESHPPTSELVIVGASRGAADDLARRVGRRRGATFGISRFSFTQLAARAAATRLATSGRTPAPMAGTEAMAARVAFDLTAASDLEYFAPVATMPGFPKALARTLHELRLAGISVEQLHQSHGDTAAAHDLARLLSGLEEQLDRAAADDRAGVFRLAAAACRAGELPWAHVPMLLLDVPADSHAELDFMHALVDTSPETLATIPDGDERVRAALVSWGAQLTIEADAAAPSTDLAHLRRYIFTNERPPVRERAGDVRLFSAPGEGREAVEIVRRVLAEAERGVPFDQMAVFLRTPQQYLGLLEHACARGGVPAYFDRGTRRPDPAGRAFIALLSCAVEGLSAKRFDEYLSLGQVPRVGADTGQRRPVTPPDEVFAELTPDREAEPDDPESSIPDVPAVDADDEAIVAGTLRSPWRWEELIVESSIVGGRTRGDGRQRWRRRLKGLAADYAFRLAEIRSDEPESPMVSRLERDLRNLVHLQTFALPIIDILADWPDRATWGDWIERFSAIATRTLQRPTRILQVLADLRPMSDVGPVLLEEARDVLHDRLVMLDWDPPLRRYGQLFVGTPLQARGRAFRIVFVPGLAERVVPQRPREDPLLLDESRHSIDRALMDQDERGSAERLLLKIAIGACDERLYLSYPRMDVAETRARVPSFYALDVMRAITGRVPDHRVLAAEAAEEAGASLAWPAPKDPDVAIDELEHDLAVLKPLLDSHDKAAVKGRAHYMLGLNEALRRSIVSRWARDKTQWSGSDGLVKVTPAIASAIEGRRLSKRAYSLSALQRFSTCPYQFMLATIHRLEPRDEPEPLLRMDPLTRGSLFHRVQAEWLSELKEQGKLPVTAATVPAAARALEVVLQRVAADYEDRLAPAIERVWKDEISELGRDLAIWVKKLADNSVWRPEYFEWSFGLGVGGDVTEGRDPTSVPDAVLVDGRFLLRGSVDLIEQRTDADVLRVTDHKTGKNRSNRDLIVGGGTVLQPVLYSAVVEEALKKKVTHGRLFYCTTVGGFADHAIELDDYRRRQGLEVLTIIDRAIERGFLAAAPADGACRWCDFRPVCGPREEERVSRKNPQDLADLHALREMR